MEDPLWTVLAVLAFVFVGSTILIIKQTKSTKDKAYTTNRKYNDIDSIAVLYAVQEGHIDSFIQETTAAEERAESDDPERAIARGLVWWTFVLAWATIVGAIVAIFTLSAIRGQLNEMQTDRRPWVSVSQRDSTFQAEVSSPFVNSPLMGAHLDVRMRIKNTGRSPALRVRVPVHLVFRGAPAATEPNLLNEQRVFCDHAKAAPPSRTSWTPEVTLFPGDEVTMRRYAGGDAAGIATVGGVPSIVGCILYETIIADKIHQTGVIWDVFRRDLTAPDGGSLIQIQPGEEIDTSELRLRYDNTFGMGPAD